MCSSDLGRPLRVSPDNEWVYYVSSNDMSLRRVSVTGSHEQQVRPHVATQMSVSPDTLSMAETQDLNRVDTLTVTAIDDGQRVLRAFPKPQQNAATIRLAWTADENAIVFIDAIGKKYSLWLQDLTSGGAATKISDLEDASFVDISGISVSRDQRRIAVSHGRWLHDLMLIRGLR